MKRIKLREICHSRAGDKGDISNLSLIVYDMRDYELIKREITASRVQNYFRGIVKGKVKRYELPRIGALNFVLHGALGGGTTRSLALDGYGKSYSSYLLSLEVEKSGEDMEDSA